MNSILIGNDFDTECIFKFFFSTNILYGHPHGWDDIHCPVIFHDNNHEFIFMGILLGMKKSIKLFPVQPNVLVPSKINIVSVTMSWQWRCPCMRSKSLMGSKAAMHLHTCSGSIISSQNRGKQFQYNLDVHHPCTPAAPKVFFWCFSSCHTQ